MKTDLKEIDIRDIKSNGLKINESYEATELGILEDEIKCLTPIAVNASLQKVEGTIIAHVEVHGVYSRFCSRCLEEIKDDQTDSFDFDYEITSSLKSIDLGEDIRQELIIGLPTKILCQDNCQGICLQCGVNLNKEKCKCKK